MKNIIMRYKGSLTKKLLVFLLLLLFFTNIYAQEAQRNQIYLIAFPLKDSVLLRWAPVNYETWQLGITYGYTITRYTIFRDSVMLQQPIADQLTPEPIKPTPLYGWKNLVFEDSYAGVAAQCLYGDSIVLTAEGLDPSEIIEKQKEEEQRFSFALHAADMSYVTAKNLALAYTDIQTRENEKYFYKVEINLPPEDTSTVLHGKVFTAWSDKKQLPVPVELKSEFSNRMVKIQWNAFVHDKYYLGWEIGRKSIQEKDYELVTKNPIANLVGENGQTLMNAYYIDSIPENYVKYSYRVRGVTAFGIRGPWSDPVEGQGIELLTVSPNITGSLEMKKGMEITWEFPQQYEKYIAGFEIYRADNHKTGFEKVSKMLAADNRTFIDKHPLLTAYYKVCAVQDTVHQRMSYPYLVQLRDSIPPKAPVLIDGVADSSGVVKLTWIENSESDLSGYRVFRSMSGKDEYSLITPVNINTPEYYDTVSTMNLNEFIYYKVVAYDFRQNQSQFSKVIKVRKPDFISPSIAVIEHVKSTDSGIELKWINSTSKDATCYIISRQSGLNSWITIDKVEHDAKKITSQYLDETAPPDSMIRYRIIVEDYSKNHSDPVYSIDVKMYRHPVELQELKFSYQVDQEKGKIICSWELPEKEVKLYKVYCSRNDGVTKLLETLQGNVHFFEDYGLKVGDQCSYQVRVFYSDESSSGYIKTETIQL